MGWLISILKKLHLIPSEPPPGMIAVTNIYYDPINDRVAIEYKDKEE